MVPDVTASRRPVQPAPSSRAGRRRRIPRPAIAAALVILVAAAIVMPGSLNSYQLFVITLVAIFALAGLGLITIMDWTGQVALAHVGFFAIGAYGAAYLTKEGLPWVLAAVLSAVLSAVIGALIGFPAARLRGFYLAIATLAFGELVQRIAVSATSITGGPAGMSVIPVAFGAIDPVTSLWYLAFGLLSLGLLFTWRVERTALGRSLLSVKEMEAAVGSNGVSALKLKVLAFAISAIFGSIAGSLFAQALAFLSPDAFSSTLLIEFLVIVFIGGTRYLVGPIIGAALVVWLQQSLQGLGAWQTLVYGGALVMTMRFLPLGIASLPSRVGAYLTGRSARRTEQLEQPEVAG